MNHNNTMLENPFSAAYGGANWSPRINTHRDEIGKLWNSASVDSEWAVLTQVIMHTPGAELKDLGDPDAAQMIELIDYDLARLQHENLIETYRSLGVQVESVNPNSQVSPNLMFCADLVFMTPEGAILARPASTVRAGEERWIARRLADIGVPILKTLTGKAVFEGADAAWLDSRTVMIGRGLRTNAQGAAQVSQVLDAIGVQTIVVDLPYGSMHLMGLLRFLDENLALTWPGKIPVAAVEALRGRGFNVGFVPSAGEEESDQRKAFNFVTLGPKHILMAANCPVMESFYKSLGIVCETVPIEELTKAAGGIGCLTGVLNRETP